MIDSCNVLAEADKKELPLAAVHFMAEQNKYHPQTNVNGMVSLGIAANKLITNETLKYLPPFLNEGDCVYVNCLGPIQLKTQVSKLTDFRADETICQSNAYCLVRLLFECFKQISLEGQFPQLDVFSAYTGASINNNNSKAHFIFAYESFLNEKEYIDRANLQPDIFVVLVNLGPTNIASKIKNTPKNFVLIETYIFKPNLQCGVLYCKNVDWVSLRLNDSEIGTVSTLFNAAVFADVNIQKPISPEEAKNAIIKMIQLESKVITPKENIYWQIGGTGAYINLAWCIAKPGSIICTDSPVYFNFHHFEEKGAILKWKNRYEKTLLERVIQARDEGCCMYVLTNPSNPTGEVYSIEEIDQVCLWAEKHPDFHLFFDEMFLNSTLEHVHIKSAIQYVNKLPNIHLERGFAKDFGICGFKVGYAITSNKQCQQKLKNLEFISAPHPYVLTEITRMLEKTNFGQKIYPECQRLLNKCISQVKCELDKSKINYIEPKGGCFFFIDVSQYFVRHPTETEQTLWRRLIKAGLFVIMGQKFHPHKRGFIRICPAVDEPSMMKGLQRLDSVINRQD